MTTDQPQEILRTEGLSKFFPGVKALDNVDFSLRRGEIMALLGENGAGKSTLIKALTGVYHADRGTIWLEGQAISPKNTAHAQQLGIGTVYQEVNLLPNMSVADNLFIGREPKRFGFLRRKEMEKRATELMTSYGFSLDVREPLNRFSVAMQQIVAICRAIDLSAKVLILDEPTNGLDPAGIRNLRDILKNLAHQEGICVMVSSHLMSEMQLMCDRVGILVNGTLIQVTSVEEMVEGMQQKAPRYRYHVEDAARAVALLEQEPQCSVEYGDPEHLEVKLQGEDIQRHLGEINRKIMETGILVYTVSPVETQRLEDAFIELTKGETQIV